MIRWFANNDIAANFLMVGILLAGLYTAFFRVPLEVTPTLDWRSVYLEMRYRGGTAKDVEKDILLPIEAALEGLKGVKMLHTDGHRGMARVWIEPTDGYDLRVLLEDVKERVDSITTFPRETERPTVRLPDSTQHQEVLTVAVTGELTAHELRRVARRVQEDLLEIRGISRVNLVGTRNYEISVEADMAKLEAYQLGFRELADAIRRSSIDLPAGAINSESGTLVVRTRGQAYTQEEFERIPVRARNGAEVLLGKVAVVKDSFEEGDKVVEFNGEPALFVEVLRTGDESAIAISDKVREYVGTAAERFPAGIHLYVWDDESLSIRGRLSTLVWSLVQGGVLVFIILGLFLRPHVAFWVVIGIPVSFAGGVLLMPWFGVTANVMSLFGYIIVLGLVVDDAIVTGENVYSRLKTGMTPLDAAVLGTKEVAVPVTFGVLTTVVAFIPLLYFEGWWGDFAKQIPPIVAPVLLFSLIESKLVLPSHLKHLKVGRTDLGPFARIQRRCERVFAWLVERWYRPSLDVAVRHRWVVMAGFLGAALLMAGYCQGGRLGFVALPTVDKPRITAWVDFPDDVAVEHTHKTVDRMEAAVVELKNEFVDPGTGKPFIVNVRRVSGASHPAGGFDKSRGMVTLELVPPSLRTVPGPKNSDISKRWLELVGPVPGAYSFSIRGEDTGSREMNRDEEPLELELRGPSSETKNEIAQKIAQTLRSYDGISGAWARIHWGQDELEFSLKPRAAELGVTQQLLAEQIRQAFYGEEAQRILRDTSDVRVMVRLPREDRESLHTLDRMKIRTLVGAEVPLATVADVSFVKQPSFIERNDRAEVIRIGASPADETVDIIGIAAELEPVIRELIGTNNPELSYQWTGHVAEHEASRRRTLIGSIALALALFALLAIPFKSLVQPIFVLVSVPFGIIGALLGHIVMGITPSHLSVFGMLALAGVVVNDALVLVDFINRRYRQGTPLLDAVREAGAVRFRPILLTSATTFVGLVPLLLDRSIQAQFLIPMAVSLGAGILFSTVITLYLIPCVMMLHQDVVGLWQPVKAWYMRPFRRGQQ